MYVYVYTRIRVYLCVCVYIYRPTYVCIIGTMVHKIILSLIITCINIFGICSV